MPTYRVICADGRVRHSHITDEFDTLADAQYWANWGHCCIRTHTYVEQATLPFGPDDQDQP